MAFIVLALLLASSVADQGPSDYANLDVCRNPDTPLLAGSTGPEVVALQNALAGVACAVQAPGGGAAEPSGNFDQATLAALTQFQKLTNVTDEPNEVSVHTMAMFDAMLGINACASWGIQRIPQVNVTPAITAGAVATLQTYWSFPIGLEIPFLADGSVFVGRLELHFHPWNGTISPHGYHHGISVYSFIGAPLSGSSFLSLTNNMTIAQRESHILLEMSRQTLQWTSVQVNSSAHNITLRVLRDYLAIGSVKDFVRFPLAAFTAQKIADLFNASLPSVRMVDLIWQAATTKIAPQPISPSPTMCSNEYILNENNLIEKELVGAPANAFIGGDKKDTVLTNQYRAHPFSVGEYGWHQLNGVPIQPLFMGHSADWADYSMGIRLVSQAVLVDGKPMNLSAVLADPELSQLLSDEGPIVPARVPIQPRPAPDCWAK